VDRNEGTPSDVQLSTQPVGFGSITTSLMPWEMKRCHKGLYRVCGTVNASHVTCIAALHPAVHRTIVFKLTQQMCSELESSSGQASWDFLEDLEVGVDLNANGGSVPQDGEAVLSSNERLKEKNRRAQKRARDKRKVVKTVHADQSPSSWCCLRGIL